MNDRPRLAAVILAAGLGTRMKSERGKVQHSVAGRPMIEYPVGLARELGAERVVCILGHQAERVQQAIEARFGDDVVEVAIQAEQRGTGHAVAQAAPALADFDGMLLILYGDVPLLTRATVENLVAAASHDRLAVMTTRPQNPRGYGRMVRGADGKVQRIVEEKDASEFERSIGEVNAGIYCGPARFIFRSIASLRPDNAQGELYLTDVVARAARELSVTTVEAPVEEVMGINDRVELATADLLMRRRIVHELMRSGVSVREPDRLYVEPGVIVGRDCELGPGVELRGRTRLGEGCRIEAGVVLTDTVVGDRVHIKPYCVATETEIGDGARIGPFAHLRPGTVLEADVHLGNFVETKKTRLGRGAKANHLTYLGDADIGAKVNVGCGTITCNYDGFAKYRTVVGDGAFIGSDTQLVAPVTVGAGAVIGAGTTITEDVPAGALALTRTKQVNVLGYADKKRARMDALKSGKPLPPEKKTAKAKKPNKTKTAKPKAARRKRRA